MKQIKTLLIASALFLGLSNVDNELEKLQKTYDAEIKNMLTELQSTVKRFQAEESTKTQEENGKRALELQATEKTIAEYRQNALKDLQQKEIELLKPVIEKARVTVQKVARAKGFQYVLDSTTGTGIIMADGYNLVSDVKADLGI